MRGNHFLAVLIAGAAIVALLSFAALTTSVALISIALGCAMLAIALIDAQRASGQRVLELDSSMRSPSPIAFCESGKVWVSAT